MAHSMTDSSILKILNRMIIKVSDINSCLFFTLQIYYYFLKSIKKTNHLYYNIKTKGHKTVLFNIKRVILFKPRRFIKII